VVVFIFKKLRRSISQRKQAVQSNDYVFIFALAPISSTEPPAE
jgi:hypothetical protein